MSWTIIYHEKVPEHPKVGDMWPAPWLVEEGKLHDLFLSDAYIAKWKEGKYRLPLIVRLPDGTDFCVDGPCYNKGKRYGGWAVSGNPPNITLAPSINIVGYYHGWIQNGVISDDCEGRKFS
jgi:hypothetical protein